MSEKSVTLVSRSSDPLDLHDLQQLETIGFMTCMTLVLLGNYAQTGHFGGPLAYTPFNVATHLVGRERGGLHFDYRRPKHAYCDKFMLAAGHCAPTCYALWMIMGEALGMIETRGLVAMIEASDAISGFYTGRACWTSICIYS